MEGYGSFEKCIVTTPQGSALVLSSIAALDYIAAAWEQEMQNKLRPHFLCTATRSKSSLCYAQTSNGQAITALWQHFLRLL